MAAAAGKTCAGVLHAADRARHRATASMSKTRNAGFRRTSSILGPDYFRGASLPVAPCSFISRYKLRPIVLWCSAVGEIDHQTEASHTTRRIHVSNGRNSIIARFTKIPKGATTNKAGAAERPLRLGSRDAQHQHRSADEHEGQERADVDHLFQEADGEKAGRQGDQQRPSPSSSGAACGTARGRRRKCCAATIRRGPSPERCAPG